MECLVVRGLIETSSCPDVLTYMHLCGPRGRFSSAHLCFPDGHTWAPRLEILTLALLGILPG